MLCETCQSIDFVDASDFWSLPRHSHYISHVQNTANLAFKPIRNDNLEYGYYLHQPSFKHLTYSKNAGCYFCAAMWYAFKEPPSYWMETPIDDQTADSETLPIVLKLWFCPDPKYSCPWRDVPEGEYIHGFCGAHEIEMRRAPVPASKSSEDTCDYSDNQIHSRGSAMI